MNEAQIILYMKEFKVSRDDAIEGIEEYYDRLEEATRDTQQDVINSTH